jgi:hypothetical protein
LGGNETAIGVIEIRGVAKGQVRQMLAVCGVDDGSRRFLIHASDIATGTRPPVVD